MSNVLNFHEPSKYILAKIVWTRHDIHQYQDYIINNLGDETQTPILQVLFYDEEVFTMAKIIRYSTENS